MLNFDVIGTNSADNEVDIFHGENSNHIINMLSEIMSTYTDLKPNFILDDNMSESDGGAFSYFGYPAVNVFQGGYPPYIHTSSDLLSSLDMDFLTKIIQSGVASLALLTNEAYTDIQKVTYLPVTMKLFQNFPNPFNQSTIIQFSLPKTSQVRLNICDVLGRNVRTLIDDNRHAGKHVIEWNARGFPSGIYLYRLETNDWTETRKLILQK